MGVVGGGDVNVLSKRFVAFMGWGGGGDVNVLLLDKQWRSLKYYLPKSVATKSKVNQSLWQWTYSWQYRYNNGKDLWTAVPHVLKHIRNA